MCFIFTLYIIACCVLRESKAVSPQPLSPAVYTVRLYLLLPTATQPPKLTEYM